MVKTKPGKVNWHEKWKWNFYIHIYIFSLWQVIKIFVIIKNTGRNNVEILSHIMVNIAYSKCHLDWATRQDLAYSRMWNRRHRENVDIMANDCFKISVHKSVRRKYILLYIQQDAMLHSLFISGNCSTCFGWYLHPSSGAHTTVSTASGICQTVTATCPYSGR